MLKKLVVVFMIVFFQISMAAAMELGKVELDDSITVGKEELILNGAGFKKQAFLKIYACGLYLKEKNKDSKSIIEVNDTMAVRMHFVFGLDIPGKRLRNGWAKSFKRVCRKDLESMKNEVEEFLSLFPKVVKKHDIIDFVYTPERGVSVCHNGKLQGTITGMDFKKAVYSLWLGEQPEGEKLKSGMLGI